MCVNLVVLRKLCETSRWFPGKFTQLAQILHDRRSWRLQQISTLPIRSPILTNLCPYFIMVVFYFHSMTSRCKIPRCTMRHKNNGSLTDHFCLRLKTSDSKSFIYLEKHLWYTSALTSLYAVLHVKKEIIISERNFEHQIPRPGSWQPEFPLERRILPHQVSSTSSYTSDHF